MVGLWSPLPPYDLGVVKLSALFPQMGCGAVPLFTGEDTEGQERSQRLRRAPVPAAGASHLDSLIADSEFSPTLSCPSYVHFQQVLLQP